MEMASVQDKEKAQEAKELYELKQRAVKFYSENGVPQKVEEILNSMFYDNPDDVYGHLANYFEQFAKPAIISKLTAREVVDSRGQPTVQTDVFCKYKNKEELVSSVSGCTESYPSDATSAEAREAGDAERQKFVAMAIEHISELLGPALAWHEPCQQQALDTIAFNLIQKLVEEEQARLAAEKEAGGETEQPPEPSPVSPIPSKGKVKSPKGKKGPAVVIIPDEPREQYFCGCNALSAVSQAVCVAGGKTRGVPLYEHIAEQRFGEVPSSYQLPLPMVSILASGKNAPGKLNCVKEFMVVPKPGMPFKESFKHITEIYNYCVNVILSKPGDKKKGQVPQKCVNDAGALCPTFDKPEQGLDMLQEAITRLNLTPGQDFHIALNCAGQETFDYEKGKYEVITGLQKMPEDLADFWADILGRYPSIIALIDPMRKQEHEAWSHLCERLSEKCYIIGNKVYHRPGLLKEEELPEGIRTSGAVLKMEHMNTVTDVIAAAKRMEDLGNQLVVAASYGDTCETFLVDLAVGMNARFFKLGAPCRGEKVQKLNRLMEIEAQLEEEGKLEEWAEHTFPLLKPETPVPEGELEEGGENEGTEKDAKEEKK